MSENNSVRSVSFSQAFACIFILLLLLLSASLPLAAASLTYDPARGKLSGFRVSRNDNLLYGACKQKDYHGMDRNVWDNTKGYVGRLLYTGAPTTFTFSNIGAAPSGSSNRFYFTQKDGSGHSREFFLVIRAKGLFHEGTNQDDFSKRNYVIESWKEPIPSPMGLVLKLFPKGVMGTTHRVDTANMRIITATSTAINTATSGLTSPSYTPASKRGEITMRPVMATMLTICKPPLAPDKISS
jgi:hypothetical protein